MRAHPLADIFAGVIAAAARLISGVQVRWVDSEPDPRQAVYFANHSSHLDFVVLWSSLPAEVRAVTRPVAAQDYWNRGLRRALVVNIFRAVLVTRHAGRSERHEPPADPRLAIEHMLEAMGDTESLILFPEGTPARNWRGGGGFQERTLLLCASSGPVCG